MGEYEPRTKQSEKSAATAGPSQADRFGSGLVGTDMQSRIIKVDVVGDRTLVTISKGRSHGVHKNMEGYVKAGGGMLAELTIESVRDYACTAFVDVTPDQLQNHLNVVINPTSKPRVVAGPDGKTRVLHVSVEGGRTKIIIARGSMHGVASGTRGRLISANGSEGDDFTIEGTTAMQSFAYVASNVDHVNQHQNVRLDMPAAGTAAIQRRASGSTSTQDVQSTAQAGVAGASSRLPHFDTIQRAFGKHDISGVQAQVGGAATAASEALGAQAYATGDKVAFAASPDLHTAAHEAAHTIQQRRGAVGFQGLGAADDEHERHADAVADAVVAGQSAEPLLDQLAHGSSGPKAIQRKPTSAEQNEEDEQKTLDRHGYNIYREVERSPFRGRADRSLPDEKPINWLGRRQAPRIRFNVWTAP